LDIQKLLLSLPYQTKQNNMELSRASNLAFNLMAKHGLIEKGWRFEFDNARRRFGVCRFGTKRIGLSQHLVSLNDEAKVKDTILHEIAHALVGVKHGHDWVWRAKAIEIGCDGERCYSSDEVVTPESRYIAECCGCKKTYKKHRKPRSTGSCGKCSGGRYNPTYKLEWKLNPNF
jgi:predicted SprT family Zn-dependent metalloprotease